MRARAGPVKLSYQPKMVHVTFTFVWKGTITEAAAGVGAYQVFRSNSLYDPDYTGVGAQPLGFDQWSTLFGVYRVYAMRYEVTFVSVVNLPQLVGVIETGNAALTTGDAAWLVQRGAKSAMIGQNAGGHDTKVFRGVVKPWVAIDKTRAQYTNDPTTAGTPAANPASTTYFDVFTIGFTAASSCSLMVRLWFDAQLLARLEFDLS